MNEARYQHLVENATDIIFVMDIEGHLISVNAAAERVFGYRREEAIGRMIFDFVAAEDRERAREMTSQKLQQGGSTTYPLTVVTRAGLRVPLEVSTQIVYEEGKPVAVQGIARDITERVREAEALERSERYFRTLTENSVDGITILNPDGKVRYSSPAIGRIMGYDPANRIGADIFEIVHPDDRATARVLFERLWDEPEEAISAVLRARHADGSWRSIQFHIRNLVRDPDVQGLVLNWHDLTEQLAADARLKEREHFFRSIIERSSDILVVLDASFTVRYVSPAFEAILGFPAGELIGGNGERFVFEDDLPKFRAMITALRDDHDPFVYAVLRARSRSGDIHTFDVRTRNLLEDPLFHGVVVDARDISERTRIEEALRESEQRFRKILETAGEGIAIRNVEGKLIFANERFASMLAYTIGELLGSNVWELMTPDSRERIQNSAERRRISGKSEQTEAEFIRKDGKHIAVILSSSPLYDADGNYVGALGMLTDMTEHKQLEEQLRQSQKIEAVGRLAGGVAHDFNNLLTAIRGHVELLLGEIGPAHPLFLDIEEIRKASDRAASLTQQLLAFSRRQILQPRVIEIDRIVQDMDTLLRRLIGEDISLVTHLHANQACIRADPGQVEQVLMNLVVNARDAMPNGGILSLTTNTVEINEAFTRANPGAQPGAHVRLLVTDTGIGMDSDTLSHLFEPFFTTKELGKGTGLGLATVYGIIKQSGGYIKVQSDPATGTTFEILFPLVPDSAEGARTNGGSTPGLTHGETVLVAEDEDAVRVLASRILKKRGYKVLEARNGEEALEVARHHEGRIDLVLTDVIMPVLGGRELRDELQRLQPDVKVLFMSGYTDDLLIERGIAQGGASFLEKPFTPDSLLTKVGEVLEAGRGSGSGSGSGRGRGTGKGRGNR